MQSVLEAMNSVSTSANNAVHLSMIDGIQRRLAEFGELVLQVRVTGCGHPVGGCGLLKRVWLIGVGVFFLSGCDLLKWVCVLLLRTCLEYLSLSSEGFSKREGSSSLNTPS